MNYALNNKISFRIHRGEERKNLLSRKQHRWNIRRERIDALEDKGQYSIQREKKNLYCPNHYSTLF